MSRFQKEHGLAADGIAGQATQVAIGKALRATGNGSSFWNRVAGFVGSIWRAHRS